jgi:hypothetical protein
VYMVQLLALKEYREDERCTEKSNSVLALKKGPCVQIAELGKMRAVTGTSDQWEL